MNLSWNKCFLKKIKCSFIAFRVFTSPKYKGGTLVCACVCVCVCVCVCWGGGRDERMISVPKVSFYGQYSVKTFPLFSYTLYF